MHISVWEELNHSLLNGNGYWGCQEIELTSNHLYKKSDVFGGGFTWRDLTVGLDMIWGKTKLTLHKIDIQIFVHLLLVSTLGRFFRCYRKPCGDNPAPLVRAGLMFVVRVLQFSLFCHAALEYALLALLSEVPQFLYSSSISIFNNAICTSTIFHSWRRLCRCSDAGAAALTSRSPPRQHPAAEEACRCALSGRRGPVRRAGRRQGGRLGPVTARPGRSWRGRHAPPVGRVRPRSLLLRPGRAGTAGRHAQGRRRPEEVGGSRLMSLVYSWLPAMKYPWHLDELWRASDVFFLIDKLVLILGK